MHYSGLLLKTKTVEATADLRNKWVKIMPKCFSKASKSGNSSAFL